MKCPVCKTECGQSNICIQCGFSELGKDFINREEAEVWFNEIVLPYRNNYYKVNVLPEVNWLDIFRQNPQVKRLFDVTIPVAIMRRSDIDMSQFLENEEYRQSVMDAMLGHIAFVSPNEMVRKRFVDSLIEAYLNTAGFKRTVSDCVERASDLATILTSIAPGESLVFEIRSKIQKDVANLFSTALSDFYFEIKIGKGQGARSIGLDVPPFTAIFTADSISNIPLEIAKSLDTVVEFNLTQDELDEIQIREIAAMYHIQLTKETVNIIKECVAQKVFKNIKGTLKYVSDYLYLHGEVQQPLSAVAMREIIQTVC